ncbi:hypothetical protein EJB05_05448, partial [Eragrostis curvula]
MADNVTPTVRDVLFAYNTAHEAYGRFVCNGVNQEQARNAVALLLWLEQGDVEAIRHMGSFNDNVLMHLAAEANSIMLYLRGEQSFFLEIPLLSRLAPQGFIDPGFFVFHQDLVVRGVADILDGVGALIFDDRLYRLLARYQTGLLGRMPPELAAPYTFRSVPVPEDCRSMFITFSRGQHVDREDIFNHFRNKWGDCIVRVLMEKTTGGAPPMYGRIIFKRKAFISLVLNGEQLVHINIGDRQIWLRKYYPCMRNV